MSKSARTIAFTIVFAVGAFGFLNDVFADTIVTGQLNSDTTWTKEGSPYIVGTYRVNKGVTLTIEPGVTVGFGTGMPSLDVYGSLIAHGTSAEPITIAYTYQQAYILQIQVFGGVMDLSYLTISGFASLSGLNGAHISFDHVKSIDFQIFVSASSLVMNDSVCLNTGHPVTIRVAVNKGVIPTVLIRNSVILGKRYYALSADSGAAVDVRNNFWGDVSGPYHSVFNKTGKGDPISGNVDFSPWLSRDPFACCSSVLFLPGFEGSRLYVSDDPSSTSTSSGDNRIWEPNRDKDIESLGLTPSGASANRVYSKIGDIIDEAYVSLAGPNIYKSFMADMNDLVATGTVKSWLPAAYDWRLSLDQLLNMGNASSSGLISYLDSTSTPYLVQEFYKLARESKTGRVSIVAHSNGGLLAKALVSYVESRGDADLVDKILFVAVPQVGTPHAIGALLHGFKEGIWPFTSPQAMRRLGQNMPGAYNLLPSLRYADFVSSPIISFSSATSSPLLVDMHDAYGDGIRLFSSLVGFLKGSEGRRAPTYADLSAPEILSPSLLDSASTTHAVLDAWIPSPSSELFEIAGRGLDTVSGIEYYEGRKGRKKALLYRPIFSSDGDGTVMLSSAWATPSTENVHRYWVDLKLASAGLNRNRDHSNILEVDDLRDFIKEILSEAPHAIRHRAQVADASVVPKKPFQKTTRVLLHSPDASLGVNDSQGRHTGRSSSGFVETQIPGSQYQELGDVTYVSIPDSPSSDGPAPVIQITSGSTTSSMSDSAFSVDVERATDDDVATSSTFEDVVVPPGGTLTIVPISDASSSTVPVLQIDDNGDGTVDREVLPGAPIPEPVSASEPEPGVELEHVPEFGARHLSSSGGRSSARSSVRVTLPTPSPSSTESFSIATTQAASATETLPMIVNHASLKDASLEIADKEVPPGAGHRSTNLAAAYISVATTATSAAASGPRASLSLISAFLVALAILWLLSCKISKSR
ncbi:MAG: hypothetical protein WC763_03290 [Candidatus Paceibacterota bacterium]|jgi:hypothetical protein